jgi:D-alanyl-lipoteichoic acid acyltransferase DltB (MBOAT superfamily)
VSFFPQILAGPIDRAVNFLPELKKKVDLDFDRVADGFKLVAWGLFKKLVIADRLAPAVDRVYHNVTGHTGPALISATILFAVQIYCDFSGYSDIAVGLSKVLGFKSMDNFNAPYFSRDIKQFWNKWHISLSTWLRDYLFLPIAYSVLRRIKNPKPMNIKVETVGYVAGMSITMFLGGLWHGARWTFVLWGALHGLYLVCSYTTKKLRKKIVKKTGVKEFPSFYRFIRVFITFTMTTFAWIFFRAESVEDAFYVVTHLHEGTLNFLRQTAGKLIFELNLSPVAELTRSLGYRPYELSVICVAVLILVFIDKAGEDGSVRARLNEKPAFYRFVAWFFLLISILLFGAAGGGEFIYFRF